MVRFFLVDPANSVPRLDTDVRIFLDLLQNSVGTIFSMVDDMPIYYSEAATVTSSILGIRQAQFLKMVIGVGLCACS